MNTRSIQRPAYRIPPSQYWPQYWSPWPVGILATFQLLITFLTIGMEIGNSVVDLFRSNVFSGFWSSPFMLSATIATYACVCTKKTQTKATIALILQIISILIMFIVIGFLMAFIATSFKLCLGFQCSQSSSTTFSSSTYTSLKSAFITCELACSIIYIILSITYIILFIKCFKKLPRIHPVVRPLSIQKRQLSNLSRSLTKSTISSNTTEQTRSLSSVSSGAQKVCPNCKHISPYIPQESIIECPSCKYQSPLVEHGQQC